MRKHIIFFFFLILKISYCTSVQVKEPIEPESTPIPESDKVIVSISFNEEVFVSEITNHLLDLKYFMELKEEDLSTFNSNIVNIDRELTMLEVLKFRLKGVTKGYMHLFDAIRKELIMRSQIVDNLLNNILESNKVYVRSNQEVNQIMFRLLTNIVDSCTISNQEVKTTTTTSSEQTKTITDSIGHKFDENCFKNVHTAHNLLKKYMNNLVKDYKEIFNKKNNEALNVAFNELKNKVSIDKTRDEILDNMLSARKDKEKINQLESLIKEIEKLKQSKRSDKIKSIMITKSLDQARRCKNRFNKLLSTLQSKSFNRESLIKEYNIDRKATVNIINKAKFCGFEF